VYYAAAFLAALASTIALPGADVRTTLRSCLRFVSRTCSRSGSTRRLLAVASLGTTLETTFVAHQT